MEWKAFNCLQFSNFLLNLWSHFHDQIWCLRWHIHDHKLFDLWENHQQRAALLRLIFICKILKSMPKIIYSFCPGSVLGLFWRLWCYKFSNLVDSFKYLLIIFRLYMIKMCVMIISKLRLILIKSLTSPIQTSCPSTSYSNCTVFWCSSVVAFSSVIAESIEELVFDRQKLFKLITRFYWVYFDIPQLNSQT